MISQESIAQGADEASCSAAFAGVHASKIKFLLKSCFYCGCIRFSERACMSERRVHRKLYEQVNLLQRSHYVFDLSSSLSSQVPAVLPSPTLTVYGINHQS